MDSRFGLPVNTVLDGSYRIVRVVGSGGFGITYEAGDINLGTQVAIKEYYPFDFGDRDASMSVRPRSERHRQTFDWGRQNFLQEARTLARFEHPSIVRVTRVFEANSTAYMVMSFERGQSFESWLKELDRLPTQGELDAIVAPMLDALEMLHAANFLHRDIAPDNIIVRADGSPVLLDFGSARQAVAQMSRKLTGIVKAGYSPHEQYSSDSRLQGPWSDLYALGGTLYRAVTGRPPDEATLRVSDDHMMSAAVAAKNGQYRRGFLTGIDACLKVRHAERPRSVAQLRPILARGSVSKVKTRRLGPAREPASRSQLQRLGEAAERSKLQIERGVQVAKRAGLEGLVATRKQATRQAERLAEASKRARLQLGRLAQTSMRTGRERLVVTGRRARRQIERLAVASQRTGRQLWRFANTTSARAIRLLQVERWAPIAKQTIRPLQLEHIKRAGAASVQWAASRRRVLIAVLAAVIGSTFGIYALVHSLPDEADARRTIESQRRTKEDSAAKARADAEASRLAAAEAQRQQEARAAEESARPQAEAKRHADAVAAEEAERRKTEAETENQRIAALTLSADGRATLVKRVQEMLKSRRCYDGAVNGSSGDTQAGLDRFVESAHKKGLEKPVRIELAKATASDFDTWLREAGDVKGEVCPAPRPKPAEKPRRAPPSQSYRGGGGGGGGGSIQGVR